MLFFDEIDAIVGGREAGAESRVLSTFLNELDGVSILIITHTFWPVDYLN